MKISLKPPSFYLPMLKSLQERRNPNWPDIGPLRIEKKTNCHTTLCGRSWGWYEIFPLKITVGYWSNGTGQDDLQSEEIERWNDLSRRLYEMASGPNLRIAEQKKQ